MPDPTLVQIHDWLRDHEDELLSDTLKMLQIPSVEGPAEPNAPFGKENRRALDLALSLCSEWGFETKDVEGFVGYGEIGQGERLVMSLGHLDVVPVGPGWKHPPFGAEIEAGYIYSRGATDDKGPTMASLYAVRAIQAVVPNLPARIRQVFGSNEESGFKCIYRYTLTEETPTYGVAPDSGWPLIHGEKGIADFEIMVPLNQGEMTLLEFGGGQRPNIVIDSASAKVRIAESVRAEIEQKLADAWDRNVTTSWEGDVLGIYAIGKAAHGSYPFGGDSAAIRIFRFLREISPVSVETYFDELFDSTHIGGAGIGIAGSDPESRDLTCNLGVVSTDEGTLKLLFNIRYPVTWTGEKLRSLCEKHLAKLASGFSMRVARDSPPLYFPLDHPLVKTIVEVYREETGDLREPTTMGGGTYARAIANTVSIGTCWPGDGGAHETDERYKVEHLFKASRIYASILYRLATMQ